MKKKELPNYAYVLSGTWENPHEKFHNGIVYTEHPFMIRVKSGSPEGKILRRCLKRIEAYRREHHKSLGAMESRAEEKRRGF